MDNVIGENAELRADIVKAYTEMGCPADKAEALVEAGLIAHNAIEAARKMILTAASETVDADAWGHILLLTIKLEMLHLEILSHHINSQLPDEGTLQ